MTAAAASGSPTGAAPVGEPAPARLRATGVTKTYGPLRALDDVSFDLAPGEVHGLCGHNGAGKSTLVKAICGLVEPDAGAFVMDGEPVALRTPLAAQAAGIALVDQELSLAPDLSVEENLQLGTLGTGLLVRPGRRREATRGLLEQVGLGDLDPRCRTGELSIGERQLIEIARMLGRDARVLILDEPTATLSDSEIEKVFAVTRAVVAEGRSVIYISHRLGEVLELCDRVTVVRDGRVVATRPTPELSGRHELIELMIGAELASAPAPSPLEVGAAPSVRVRGLAVPPLVSRVDLEVRPGEVVGLTGQVGSGTTEVLRALAGLVPDAVGTLEVDGDRVALGSPVRALRRGVAFASNDRKSEGLFLERASRDNLIATRLRGLTRLGWYRGGVARKVAGRLAAFVGLDERRLGTAVESLSGGNQQKVLLGRCLDRPDVRLLLLDEPTRGVDVAGRAEIHELLRAAAARGVAVVFASTEVDEVLDLSATVVTMFGGDIVAVRPRADVTPALLSHDMTLGRERERRAAA